MISQDFNRVTAYTGIVYDDRHGRAHIAKFCPGFLNREAAKRWAMKRAGELGLRPSNTAGISEGVGSFAERHGYKIASDAMELKP